MITTAQKKQIDWLDDQIKNYKKYKAIDLSKQEKEYKKAIKRRTQLRKLADNIVSKAPKTITRYNREVILEKDITEDIIEKETEFWEMLGRDK